MARASWGRCSLNCVRQASQARCSGVSLQVQAHVQVHALMGSIVLRMGGTTAHDANAERDPPGRQQSQSRARADADKGRPVVDLDGDGEPKALEKQLELG